MTGLPEFELSAIELSLAKLPTIASVHHPLIQHYYLPPMPSLCGLKEAIEALERPETPNQVGSAIIKAVNVNVNSAADANRATNVNRTATANIVVNFNQG